MVVGGDVGDGVMWRGGKMYGRREAQSETERELAEEAEEAAQEERITAEASESDDEQHQIKSN